MLLRSSISKTRKLFQKTLENFKSLFTNGYQKLPKTPVCKPCNSRIKNNNTKQNFRQFDAIPEENSKKTGIRNGKIRSFRDQDSCFVNKRPPERETRGNFRQFDAIKEEKRDKTRIRNGEIRSFRDQDCCFIAEKARERERKRFPVTEKLKELERVMDMRNSDHVMDIQEFLHYYSRLNSPAYLDIVDDFFQEMCNELLEPMEPPRRAVSSRPKGGGSAEARGTRF